MHNARAAILFLCAFALELAPLPAYSTTIGLNKFDLVPQYLGTASGGDASEEYRRITQAMARKSMDDARDIGVTMFRSAATGYGQAVLGLWKDHPDRYWEKVDILLNDLHERKIKWVPVLMWNAYQFPQFTGERLDSMIKDPKSKSYVAFESYVRAFVLRYRDHPALEFYELSNELNLQADIDFEKKCIARQTRKCFSVGNISTDDLIDFSRRVTRLIRSLDNKHNISSGFSVPRPSAWHLWARTSEEAKRHDWTADNPDQMEQYLRAIHGPFDIISVHIYGDKSNARFGETDPSTLIRYISEASRRIGKPLFLGEFGAPVKSNEDIPDFTDAMLDEIVRLNISYSAVWVWEFYQLSPTKTRATKADRTSLEPGYTDAVIRRIRKINRKGDSDPGAEPDQAPRIVLTAPQDCSARSNNVTLFAVASSSDLSMPVVTFFANGAPVGNSLKPPYRAEVGKKMLRKGMNEFHATACTQSELCTSSRTVRVVEDSGAQCDSR